ncbi:hypothetical protein ACWGNN_27835 [Streptomyces sp. NPDC055817]
MPRTAPTSAASSRRLRHSRRPRPPRPALATLHRDGRKRAPLTTCSEHLLSEALALIDDLEDDAAYCLALTAAVTSPPPVGLVKRSLAHGFAEDVTAPLTALNPARLQEIAAQLGVSGRPPNRWNSS